ncbi:DUF309 domain-containing protein [Stygiolobus caldivivus]|uniref:DUF309 domain-containing protein n=1 Tax=Stygiolobus caldivivus TaxID=2824673 RepID=A0A8D5ZK69_9CREN|nr:DUF309 domain-containing protein [Stygiolobus caldivivus]BCU71416.1 hypothetical protein KN1_27130 [Stygiolobus caldivivus]
MIRKIYYYKKEGISSDLDSIKAVLRQKGVKLIDIRVCKYVEIDFFDEDDEDKVVRLLGKPLFTNCERCSFEELFFNFRFWEAHEELEKKWKVEEDIQKKKYLQSLILISASLIKYCKGEVNVSDKLLSNALSLIAELPEELLPLFYINFALDP